MITSENLGLLAKTNFCFKPINIIRKHNSQQSEQSASGPFVADCSLVSLSISLSCTFHKLIPLFAFD